MTETQVAICISIFSALIAGFALGWNIYRDVIIKPRLKARLQVCDIFSAGDSSENRPIKIVFRATNFGPGKIVLNGISGKGKNLPEKKEWMFLITDFTDPLCGRFPCELEVGKEQIFTVPFKQDCFLKENIISFGIADSFGRHHWVPKKDIELAKDTYNKSFSDNK